MAARPEVRRAGPLLALAFALAFVLGDATQALAQVPPGYAGGPQWRQHVQRWERLPAQRRRDILREQQRYRRLPPREQRRLFEQYRRERR